MKVRFLTLMLSLLLQTFPSGATKYISIKNGGWTSGSTWKDGTAPALPVKDSVFIKTNVTNFSSIFENYGFIRVDTGAYFITTNKLDNYGSIRVYGYMDIQNNLDIYTSAGLMEIFTTGRVCVTNNIFIEGHLVLYGGKINYQGNLKGKIQGSGTITKGLNCNGPLGIELVDFEAVYDKGQVAVTWVTANEENNDHFTVEKSRDLKDWTEVAQVPGSLKSSGYLHYQVTDDDPIPGISYYRLKQTDIDGSEEVFHRWTRAVNCSEKEADFRLYPNPAGPEVNLLCKETPSEIVLRDMNGKMVYSARSFNSPHQGYIQLNLGGLPDGMFLVTLKTVTGKTGRQLLLRSQ